MNIAIIRHSILNRGSDNALFDYADYLIHKGHRVSYYTNEIRTDLKWNPGIAMKQIPFKGKLGTVMFVLLTKFPEEIVALDLIALSCLAWIRNKKKLVYLARGFDVTYYSSLFMRELIKFLYRLGLDWLGIRCICASEYLAKNLAPFQPKHLVTVTNGVDTKFFHKNSNSPFQKNKTKDEKVILLYTRNEYVKGLDIAQKAINELVQTHPDNWTLWTIGPQTEINFSGKVVRQGFLDKNQLRDILSATDIFLMPSRSEGLSPLLLQALACECAVVATDAAHIITDEEDGLICAVEDWKSLAAHMKKLLQNPTQLQQLNHNARKLAEKFSLQKSCEEFEQAILNFSISNP